jgi:hypothetical protein
MAYADFKPDNDDILAIATKTNGNISQIADHFKVSRETVYQYLKRNPEGKAIIDRVRGLNTETELDLAEHVIRYNMANYKSNGGLAQRAAEKVIDKKGYIRGWKEVETIRESPHQAQNDYMHENMILRAELQELKEKLNANQSQTG